MINNKQQIILITSGIEDKIANLNPIPEAQFIPELRDKNEKLLSPVIKGHVIMALPTHIAKGMISAKL